MIQKQNIMNTKSEFNRNTSLRKAIRWRTKSQLLTPYAPSMVKKAQKHKIRNLVEEIPLNKVYEAIVLQTSCEELNNSFYIDDEDAHLLAAHRSSLRNSIRNRRKAKNSKEKVSKTSSVPMNPKQIKLKVCRAISAIDRFFTKS